MNKFVPRIEIDEKPLLEQAERIEAASREAVVKAGPKEDTPAAPYVMFG